MFMYFQTILNASLVPQVHSEVSSDRAITTKKNIKGPGMLQAKVPLAPGIL
jgi:hypothetical protein